MFMVDFVLYGHCYDVPMLLGRIINACFDSFSRGLAMYPVMSGFSSYRRVNWVEEIIFCI